MKKYTIHCLSKNYKEYKWVVARIIGFQHDYYQVILTNDPHEAFKEIKHNSKLIVFSTEFVKQPFYDTWGDFWKKVLDFIRPV